MLKRYRKQNLIDNNWCQGVITREYSCTTWLLRKRHHHHQHKFISIKVTQNQ